MSVKPPTAAISKLCPDKKPLELPIESSYAADMSTFPALNFENRRVREFKLYSEEERAAAVYHYLVTGMSMRKLDREVLYLDSNYSKGYQSMGILHYLGICGSHKGVFKHKTPIEMLSILLPLCKNPSYCIIYYYLLEYIRTNIQTTINENWKPLTELYPEENIKGQNWIRNTLLSNTQPPQIDQKLISLPDENHKLVIKNQTYYYSNAEVKESVKSLYDYHCQVCGQVIYRTGWNNSYQRKDQWKFMSADIHHILPLSQNGPDLKANMICLCPTCHRKFHSGEFRLVQNSNKLILKDELLGHKQLIENLKHDIYLY